MMITPTLRQLDIFAQMVASGSIADCAHDLGVTAMSVERELEALEQRMGHRLFDLRSGMAVLTPAGRKAVAAMQMLSETAPEQWGDARAEVEDMPAPAQTAYTPSSPTPEPTEKSEQAARAPAPLPLKRPATTEAAAPRQHIMIAAHPSIFAHFQDALSAFEQANGDVAIALDLDTHTAAQAIPLLAQGRADIAYFYALGEPEGMASRYVWSEQLSLYIGTAHPVGARDMVSVADLIDVPPVMLAPGNSLRAIIDRALESAGIAGAAPALESDNLFEIMTAVREGRGYFAAFGPLARDFGRMQGIRRLPFATQLPSIDVRQAVADAGRGGGVVGALAEYLFR